MKTEVNKIRTVRAIITIIISFILAFLYCGKKEENRQSIEQYNADKSNDYKYIFREEIKKEHRNKTRYKENEFKN
jgi:hypothetical protein